LCPSILVDKHAAHQRIGEKREILGRFCIRNREPCGREKRSDIATAAAVSAVVATWMVVMRDRQLCATIGQVRQADLLRPFLNDVVNAAERNWREVLAIGIARPILNG